MGGTTAADGGGSRTLFRWIKTARYVVAVTVMVLIVVVISYAIKMVVRERSLLVRVAGSTVNVQPLPKTSSSSDKNLSFSLTIRASNPSGFSKIYYTNITALLVGKINASLPATSSYDFGPLPDLAVQPRTWMSVPTVYHASIDKNRSYNFMLSYLYNGSSIRNAVLRLNGTLSTEVYNYYNHSGTVIYCCSSIFVGDEDDNDNPAGTPDMPCREQHITGSDRIFDARYAPSILSCD